MIRGSSGKELIEKLIFMGRNEEVVEIEGVSFTLTSLSESQNKELLDRIFSLTESERLSHSKSIAVACSLTKINEYDISTFSKEVEEGDTELDKRLVLVSKMQASVVSKLYAAFEKMNIKPDANEASEQIKNS